MYRGLKLETGEFTEAAMFDFNAKCLTFFLSVVVRAKKKILLEKFDLASYCALFSHF